MPIDCTGSDSYNATISIYDTDDAVLGGSTTAPACLPLVELANRTTYLNSRRVDDARAVVEASSGGRATILEDPNGNWHYMAKIGILWGNELDPSLCRDSSASYAHPAFYNSASVIDYLYIGLYYASVNSAGDLQTMPNVVPKQASMASAQGIIASSLSGPSSGWHMMSVHEWGALGIISLSRSAHLGILHGNTDSGYYRDSGTECGIMMEPDLGGDFYTYPGSGPNTWRHDFQQWGVADLVGNYHEFVDKIKIIDRKMYFSATNKLSDVATGTLTDQGFYIAKNGVGDLIYNTTSITVDSTEYNDKFTALEMDASISGVTAFQSSLVCDLMLAGQWVSGGSSGVAPALFTGGECMGTVFGTLSAGTQYLVRGGDYGTTYGSSSAGISAFKTYPINAGAVFRLCYYEP